MRKNGNYVEISAVLNGRQIFWASPPVQAAGEVIEAAVKTWLTRGWEAELMDMIEDDEDDSMRGLFQ